MDATEFVRVGWDESLWEDIREQLLKPARLPPRGSEDRTWLEAKPTRTMLVEMVSILDGLDRLIALAERNILDQNPVLENWLTSIRGLQRRMVRSLERVDVRSVPSIGRPFDPHLHEAVEVRKDERYPPGTVVEVREKPYRWGDKVLRVGKVAVTPKAAKISTSI